IWSSTLTLAGTLTGTLIGELSWDGTLNIPTTATLAFTGLTDINWKLGTISGGGTLTNQYNINLTTANIKYLTGGTTLINSENFRISDSGDLYISDGTFVNPANGIIDLQVDSANLSYNSTGSHVLS